MPLIHTTHRPTHIFIPSPQTTLPIKPHTYITIPNSAHIYTFSNINVTILGFLVDIREDHDNQPVLIAL